MTAPRPTFRVMKNGYDRFAVDDAIERYAAQIEDLQQKQKLYEEQMQKASEQLARLQAQYSSLENSVAAEKQAAENIARISLREANQIIATAQDNADMIVRQALITAKEILLELSRLYNDADTVKASTRVKLESLMRELDSFRLPKLPDLSWLEEAEKKLR